MIFLLLVALALAIIATDGAGDDPPEPPMATPG